MATFTRNNAWNNGGTLAGNPDLLWYAIGVGEMMKRDISDPKSWWYFGAIHGQGQEWAGITAPPQVPPLPDNDLQGWEQCQHGTYYFPPWHRGYLIALEQQVRADVVARGGPSTWALPYWNYFGPNTQYNIPPAFMEQNFPANLPANVPAGIAGSPNPLFVSARYGPNGDGVIFVPTPAYIAANPNFSGPAVTFDCMSDTVYTTTFGGAVTGFNHDATSQQSFGDLENNPHNFVHGYVGNFQGNNQGNEQGLMGDPNMAALDPIFYLHHGEIDRLWAIWNVTSGNTNGDATWLAGPTTNGQSDFEMPVAGNWWLFTPGDVATFSNLTYTYDDLSAPAGLVTAAQALSHRVAALRAAPAAAAAARGPTVPEVELMGATQAPVAVTGSGARTSVRLDTGVRRKTAASLAAASAAAPPDHVYLRLQNIVGTTGGILSVYINLPDGGKPGEHPKLHAGSIGLFGLRQASDKTKKHGGKGINYTLDITKVIDELHLSNSFNLDTLNVSLVPNSYVPDSKPITVGRISIYRQSGSGESPR
jgi:tyrosinase